MKVKVRIAVAVDSTGFWNSCGWSECTDTKKMDSAISMVNKGERRYWLEAELDAPETTTVKPTVMEAK